MLGGGPAHVQVLAAFARERPAGLEAMLIAPAPDGVDAARLPALVAGDAEPAACSVALAPLTAAAGVALVAGTAVALDARQRVLRLADGRSAEYELLSIDGVAQPRRDALPGAREHGLFVHPPEAFARLLPAVLALAQERVLDVVVVGESDAAFELALAFEWRLNGRGPERARVAWVTGGPAPLADWPEAARLAGTRRLQARRITIFREGAAALRPGAVVLASGARLACDVPVLATGTEPPPWLAASGLALDGGAVQAGPTLQSPSHPEVFAAPEAGAAAGALLAENLRRFAGGGTLQTLAPAARGPRWLWCGPGRAIGVWGGLLLTGRAAGWFHARAQRRRAAALAPAGAAPPAGAIRAA